MKPLRVVVPLVLAGVIVLIVTWRLAGRSDADAFRIQREVLRREMIERSVVARGASGPVGVEEARTVLRWWLDSSAALRNRHPGASRSLERSRPAGKEAAKDEPWYRYADERLDAIRGGYTPLLSASDQGLRFDVLTIRAGENPDTHERGVKIDFAVWGAPRRIEREGATADAQRGAQRVVVPLSFRQIGFRFVDAAGKTYGEMNGSGEPYLVLKDPERFSNELPPEIAFGTWWVELFPRAAARVELSVGIQVQGMGAAVLSPAFRWEVPVADEWKLRPGEAFRAETREAPPEPARR
jgi:hypothetical protein